MCMYVPSAAALKPRGLKKSLRALLFILRDSPPHAPLMRNLSVQQTTSLKHLLFDLSTVVGSPFLQQGAAQHQKKKKNLSSSGSVHSSSMTARCVYVHHSLSVGQIPSPAPIPLSANPDANWIVEVWALCSWMSRIRRTNLKALGIFKRSHRMKRNINQSAD